MVAKLMSDFNAAVEFVLGNEGGFVIDDGGATNYGITAHYLMDEGLWQYDFDKDGTIGVEDMRRFSRADAIEVYHTMYFRNFYNVINDTELAKRVFDMGVNAGVMVANEMLQRCYNQIKGTSDLKVDGIIGKKTLLAVNSVTREFEKTLLINAFHGARYKYYKSLIDKNPEKYERYATDWYERAYK